MLEVSFGKRWLDPLARGAGYRFLAQRFGVTPQTIGRIARGKYWRHVPDPLPGEKGE